MAHQFFSSQWFLHSLLRWSCKDFDDDVIMSSLTTDEEGGLRSCSFLSQEEQEDSEIAVEEAQLQQNAERDDNYNLSSKEPTAVSTSDNDTHDSPGEEEGQDSSFLSQALRIGTQESHTAAENVHFVNNFINGIIDRELYKDLLTGLYHTYVTLEKLLEEHAPTCFPTLHFPKELSRKEALEEDMEYWHGCNWKTRPECSIPSPAVKDYMDRMTEVGRLDPLLLLSHAYTRYLGDLSGGKVLSRIARRALNLGKGYDGLQFYNFDSISSAKLFKDKYRIALDELVLQPNEIGKLVAEANVAFALNMRVFEELDVKGGMEGARLRNVREALSYYDIEMELQKSGGRSKRQSWQDMAGEVEEAKCPFGFKGGPNPHGRVGGASSDKTERAVLDSNEDASFSKPNPSTTGAVLRKEHTDFAVEGGGRCPWPFVFFHDPVLGMKDWQTWFVIGAALRWSWSYHVVQ